MRADEKFEAYTGFDGPDKMVSRGSSSTRRIYNDYILSPGRLVTFSFEPYSIIAFGQNGGIHIRVWEDRLLTQTIFVDPAHIFKAYESDMPYEDASEEPKIRITKNDREVVLMEYRVSSETDEMIDVWYVNLLPEEFANLYERLLPLKGYDGEWYDRRQNNETHR